jgi:hypothetical protein
MKREPSLELLPIEFQMVYRKDFVWSNYFQEFPPMLIHEFIRVITVVVFKQAIQISQPGI